MSKKTEDVYENVISLMAHRKKIEEKQQRAKELACDYPTTEREKELILTIEKMAGYIESLLECLEEDIDKGPDRAR